MGSLEAQVCLITGSTGIAEAAAIKAVEEGAKVFVASRTESNCRALAQKLGEHGAYRAADLTEEGEVEAAVAQVSTLDQRVACARGRFAPSRQATSWELAGSFRGAAVA